MEIVWFADFLFYGIIAVISLLVLFLILGVVAWIRKLIVFGRLSRILYFFEKRLNTEEINDEMFEFESYCKVRRKEKDV